MTMELNNQST